jgi:GT2 family glycosyltransferase
MLFSAEVSIVVVNLNRADLTLDCLKSVSENTEAGLYEIILVDNGSDPAEIEQLIQASLPPVSLVRLNRNMFFGEASNIGAERAANQYVVFLNNDVKVTFGWLSIMLDVFRSHLRVGAVGPKFLALDGSLQEAGAYILPESCTWQLGKVEKELPASYVSGIQLVDYCSAACLLMRRKDFLSLGGFDPIFEPAYFEDVDLAVRLRSMGLFTYYCGQSEVFHQENATSRRIWTAEQRNAYTSNSRRKFAARWGDYLQRRVDQWCEPDAFPQVGWKAEAAAANDRRRMILYSSNPLSVSEASRKLLLVASAFQSSYDVVIAADEVISRCRVYSLCREFGIELASFRTRNIIDVVEAGDDLVITFETERPTRCRFNKQIKFEDAGYRLLALLTDAHLARSKPRDGSTVIPAPQ